MNQTKMVDPFEMWKSIYDQTETYWSNILEKNLATEDFSKSLGKVLDMNLQYKKIVNESTKNYLDQMNMPSKDDIARLATLILNVENKVDQVEEVVEKSSFIQKDYEKLSKDVRQLQMDVMRIHKQVEQMMKLLNKK